VNNKKELGMMKKVLKAPSCMHTYSYSTTVQKHKISSQNYDPVPCIHVEAIHKMH